VTDTDLAFEIYQASNLLVVIGKDQVKRSTKYTFEPCIAKVFQALKQQTNIISQYFTPPLLSLVFSITQRFFDSIPPSMSNQETLRQAFPDKATPLISYGLPFTDSCMKHITKTFKTSRVYLIASTSLTHNTSHTSSFQAALGSRLVKTRVGMTPHTLMSEVLEIVEECRMLEVDCIVTLGGGSISDGAKIISFVPPPFHPPYSPLPPKPTN
jgi:hypothetical protein